MYGYIIFMVFIISSCFMSVRGAEILKKRGIQRPVSYFKNTQVLLDAGLHHFCLLKKNFSQFCALMVFTLLVFAFRAEM